MKRLIFIFVFSLLLAGCGVGTYSIQSGIEDVSGLSFTDDAEYDIVVKVDDKIYNVGTVKSKAYKSGRNIKQTARKTLRLSPGQHDVVVLVGGSEVYNHKVFVSAGETKIIEL